MKRQLEFIKSVRPVPVIESESRPVHVRGVRKGYVFQRSDGTRFLVTSLNGAIHIRDVGGRRRIVEPEDWKRYRGQAVLFRR